MKRNHSIFVIVLTVFLSLNIPKNVRCQTDTSSYIPYYERKIIDTIITPIKWPYLNGAIPKNIGLLFGYEGFSTQNFTIGFIHNILNLSSSEAIGGNVGYALFYKKNFNAQYPSSIELDIGIFSGIAFGFNINYNQLADQSIMGYKPFIGISLFHLDFLYGYSLYNSKKDTGDQLRHNRFTIRYSLPIIKLTKQKEMRYYVREDYPEY